MIAAEQLPQQRPPIDVRPSCWRCGRTLFGYCARPWSKKCEKCNADNYSAGGGHPDARLTGNERAT